MSFISELKTDFADVFCDPTEFGENIVYTAKRPDYIEGPAAPESGDKTIPARVVRDKINPRQNNVSRENDSQGNFPINGVRFYISRDAADGIATVQPSFDKVTIPIKGSGTAEVLTVTKILEETIAYWYLQAEK